MIKIIFLTKRISLSGPQSHSISSNTIKNFLLLFPLHQWRKDISQNCETEIFFSFMQLCLYVDMFIFQKQSYDPIKS